MQAEIIVQSIKFIHDKTCKGLINNYVIKDDGDVLHVVLSMDKGEFNFLFGISKEETRNKVKIVFKEEMQKEKILIRVDADRQYVYVNENWHNQLNGSLENIDSLVFDQL